MCEVDGDEKAKGTPEGTLLGCEDNCDGLILDGFVLMAPPTTPICPMVPLMQPARRSPHCSTCAAAAVRSAYEPSLHQRGQRGRPHPVPARTLRKQHRSQHQWLVRSDRRERPRPLVDSQQHGPLRRGPEPARRHRSIERQRHAAAPRRSRGGAAASRTG